MSPFSDSFDEYWHKGWRGLFWLPARQKASPPPGYTGAQGAWPSYADVHAWSDEHENDGANIGVRLPPIVIGIDVDHYGDKRGGDVLRDKEKEWVDLPPTVRLSSRSDAPSGIRLYVACQRDGTAVS